RQASASVGRDEPCGRAADARLMSDLDPAAMTLPGDVEHRLPGKSTRAIGGEARVGTCQRTKHAGVVCFGATGGKVPAGCRGESRPLRDGADHVRLERYGRGRGRRARDLRVEKGDQTVGTLRGESRRWIEEAEITRVRLV